MNYFHANKSTYKNSRLVLARVVSLLFLFALAACSSSDDGDDGNQAGSGAGSDLVTLSLRLTGAEEVPPVDEPDSRGSANITVNTSTGALRGSVSVSNLSSNATMAHIHDGFAGNNGAPVFELISNSDGSEWFIPTDLVLDAPQLAAITAGQYYFNVHSENHPAGEIRAQIVFGDVSVIRSTLSGENSVPAVETDATGSAVTTVNSVTGDFNGVIFTDNLENATVAHVHMGLAGATGAPILDLMQDESDASVWRSAPGSVLNADGLAALAVEGLYYNVHTAANPDGEIRGQIVAEPLAGEQEFTVTIENVSTEFTLPLSTGSEAVPLSPGAYIVHREDNNPLVLPLDMASAELESLAEDGDPSGFPDAVPGSVIFDTPVGSTQAGPIFAENAYSFTFTASPGDKLSFVTMFVESNDWFYTTSNDVDNSISLFDDSGNPVTGDVSSQIDLWESGTEVDETPGEGPNQAGQGSAPNTGETESTGVGSLAGKGVSFAINGPVIQVTIELN